MSNAIEPPRGSDIKYINPQVPTVELPGYQGERYEATVPDTLDIAQRAALAIHGLTSTTDPEADYEIYWALYLDRQPPYMFHSWNDHCGAKYMDALPLLRLASGSIENLDVERRWMEVMLQMQGPDGLLYFPKGGRPWWPNECYGPQPHGDHYTSICVNGRLLGAITIYYLLTGEDRWTEAGRRFVDGLNELATHDGFKAYFDWIQYGPGKQAVRGDLASITHNFAHWFAWTVQGLANYYKATGYAPAIDLSGKLARWIIEGSGYFDADGTFLPDHAGTERRHFHGHTMVLLALLDNALVTGDANTVDFVRNSFEFAKGEGNTVVGYFPASIGTREIAEGLAETCGVADMVALALKLSAAGVGDYWDDADRWIRNQFAESQLREADWISAAVADEPVASAGPYETTDEVGQRALGCFGFCSANDWWGGHQLAIMACCNGNGARTIYYVWENILTYQNGKLRVNLLLNRASPWADVNSGIPYQGRVDVKVKKACQLEVRIPEWITPEQTQCRVDETTRSLGWNGRYALVGTVDADQQVIMTFPISERTEKTVINEREYTIVRKGNEVISIDPPGQYCPLYQREKYRADKVQRKQIERFVADEMIEW